MSEHTNLWVILLACMLLVGVSLGHSLWPSQVVKEVPVEKVVEKTVDKIVTETVTVTVDDQSKLDAALAEFEAEIADDKELRTVDGNRFSADEISVSELKEYSVETDSSNRRDTLTTVKFTVEMKYNSADDDDKAEYRTFDVEVVFHSNSKYDTEIEVSD